MNHKYKNNFHIIFAHILDAIILGQPCAAEPCLHEGKCHNVGGKVECSCLAGYYGDKCEQKGIQDAAIFMSQHTRK